ncbi:hypothetical protein SCHAM137S_01921 [Streptomyces chartreusis]
MHTRYLDLHMLEHRPPSCLNRDQHNVPKTMTVGNAKRIMVPAQTQRRPLRLALEDTLEEPATRTRYLPPHVAQALRAEGWPEDLAHFAAGQIARSATAKGLETDPKNGHRTNAMLLVAADSIVEDLAKLCTDHRAALEKGLARLQKKEPDDSDDPKPGRRKPPALLPTDKVAACLSRPTATIHLFGRMLAGLTDADVPSAVQTAPALTTHKSDLQPDFVTAVDDWLGTGDRGSAFMDTSFLTSGVFYRFTTVNLTDLTRKLDGDQNQALRLTGLFMRAAIMTVLPAKQTSTAPHTVPEPGRLRRPRRPPRHLRQRLRTARASSPPRRLPHPQLPRPGHLRRHHAPADRNQRPRRARLRHRPDRRGSPPRHPARQLRSPHRRSPHQRGRRSHRPNAGGRRVSALLLRLAGPLAAFGTSAAFHDRDTAPHPTRSALIGMFANCAGRAPRAPYLPLHRAARPALLPEPGIPSSASTGPAPPTPTSTPSAAATRATNSRAPAAAPSALRRSPPSSPTATISPTRSSPSPSPAPPPPADHRRPPPPPPQRPFLAAAPASPPNPSSWPPPFPTP